MQKFHIDTPVSAESILKENSQIILVDASDSIGISPRINRKNVIDVIDHRPLHEKHAFPHATFHIEMVGSSATLIAEKFYLEKIVISPESAALLYSAIISNTVNFKATVTTERDTIMTNWLLQFLVLPLNYTHEMFKAKSTFTRPLQEIFKEVFGSYLCGNK